MKRKYFLITLLMFVLDQVSKRLAVTRLEGQDAIEIISGYLRLSFTRNSGVAFGLFTDIQSAWKPVILALLAVAAIVVILIYSARTPSNRILLQTALSTTMGGILGNLADRIIHGSVVDFIEFHIHESFYWPTFNVADSAITTGIALLMLDALKNPAAEEAQQQSFEWQGAEARTPEQTTKVGEHESGK